METPRAIGLRGVFVFKEFTKNMKPIETAGAVKVIFRFFNTVLDEDYVESMWAQIVNQEQGLYQLDNIPFFVTGYALGDVVLVEEEEGELVVKDLVVESGNTTLHIIAMQADVAGSIQQALEKLGCSWEGSHLPGYFSVNVPQTVKYAPIKRYLKQAEKQGALGFREACLVHNTR
ncbi:DUF4265 domain-containing protein [Hymenobacter sp. J193]|uniref:DUF4265 domain-containing protein n=1 Tax=Hymenobacter sp. J193 TaxID=2898429 RepID=UPI002150F247|nr:DUF4265 domain-containing protein [Hymenobacter sp. J193]MCR5890052.1 DUF4265 domain-containing protein [Hymenobacter sp. J193]